MNPPTTPGLALRPYFDPFDPALHTDPYVRYAAVREAAAVGEGPHNLVVVTRHADVSHALRDNRLGHGPLTAPNRIFSFLGMDPPDHGPLRRLRPHASSLRPPSAHSPPASRPSSTNSSTVPWRSATSTCSPTSPTRCRCAWSAACSPCPSTSSRGSVSRPRRSPASSTRPTPSRTATGRPHTVRPHGFVAYLHRKINERRQNPGPDALSALIAEADTGATPERRTLLPMCALLLMAGYETTANLIANGVLALLRHPDQLNTARGRARSGDGRLDGRAMNELLRYDPSIQITFRTVQRPAVVMRRSDGSGQPRRPADRVGQPRSPCVHQPRTARRRPRTQPASELRRGHPLLPGRTAGPAGGLAGPR